MPERRGRCRRRVIVVDVVVVSVVAATAAAVGRRLRRPRGRHPVGVGLGAERASVSRVPGDVHVYNDVLPERAHHVQRVLVHDRAHAPDVAAAVPIVPVAAHAARVAADVHAQPSAPERAAAAGRTQADRSDAQHPGGVRVPVPRMPDAHVRVVRRRPRVYMLVRSARPVHGGLVPLDGRVL